MVFKNLLLSAGILFTSAIPVNAQTYGQWVGATTTSYWDYNLTATAATLPGAATDVVRVTPGVTPFLPVPPSSSMSRAYIAGNSNGAFELLGTSLKITSGNVGIAKFSSYQVENASAVTSFFFDIDFNSSNNIAATNGNFILGIGKHITGNVFGNTNNITTAISPGGGLFGALQFAFFGGTNVQVHYRKPVIPAPSPATYTYSAANTSLIPNRTSGVKRIEIYCNNSSTNQYYQRAAGVNVELPKQTFHVYIGGVAAVIDGVTNIPATSEGLVENDVLDGFTFNASGNNNSNAALVENRVPNVLNFTLSNIKIGGIPQRVLPVAFKSFTGIKKENAVDLSWSTAAEPNNEKFEILRSIDGVEFKSLGGATAKGNNTEGSNYIFSDFNPVTGTNYYKLKQVDKDGNSAFYDKLLSFSFGIEKSAFSAYVNSENKLQLTYSVDKESSAEIVITDITGKKITATKVQLKNGLNQVETDLKYVPAGIYIATVSSYSGNSSIKFIKE